MPSAPVARAREEECLETVEATVAGMGVGMLVVMGQLATNGRSVLLERLLARLVTEWKSVDATEPLREVFLDVYGTSFS